VVVGEAGLFDSMMGVQEELEVNLYYCFSEA
jgi:hypothetical protein